MPVDYPLKPEERVLFSLRELYRRYGYSQFKMSKFEEYDFYARNKDFLISDGVITFTDTDGRLMALKPDVTLSIIKNTRPLPGCVQKLYYSENVYRVSGSTRSFKEIMQTGLECIGDVDLYGLSEVISLAVRSLQLVDTHSVLDLSHMGVISSLVDALDLDAARRAQIIECIAQKNSDGVQRLCPDKDVRGLLALIDAHGPAPVVVEQMRPWCADTAADAPLRELEQLCNMLEQEDMIPIQVDFSIVNDMNYYNGIVFQGFIDGIPSSVLSGGQYDKLMQRMGYKARAIGFAIYMDLLERLLNVDRPYDVDVLLLYDDQTDPGELTRAISAMTQAGTSVSAQKAIPEKLRYKKLLHFSKGGLQDV